jgi:hypothetical protein
MVCAGKMSAAEPWRWHNADNMRTTRVCAHTTPGQRKARPWLDGGVLSLWVPAANRSSATHVEQRNDTTAWQRSARGDDGSGTCKRPARLDGRLSSDGRSARRRGAGQRATYKQRAHKARSSLSSKVGSTTRSRGFRCSPRAPAAGGEVVTGRGSGADTEQRMQNRARRGSDRGRRTTQ